MNNGRLDIIPFIWLLLLAFAVAILVRRLRVPYALGLVVTGLAVGAPRLLPQVHLEPRTLLTVFLPPLLFESAINLETAKALARAVPPTLLAGECYGSVIKMIFAAVHESAFGRYCCKSRR